MKNKKAISIVWMLLVSAGLTAEVNSKGLVEIECTVTPIERSKIHPKNEKDASAAAAPVASTSSNWSGYASAPSLTKSNQGSVTYVAGSWIVPTILASKDATYCAIWVGIDGLLSSSVEQIGTSHNWENGAQNNYAWFEMYPNGAFIINNFPVDRGDVISARVGYKGNDTFKMVIMNHTKGVTTMIPVANTTAAGSARSSAEWIVEAPYSSAILPLSDFGITKLNYCSAIINGKTGAINDPSWAAEMITMGSSSIIKALPSQLTHNGNSFQVTWESQ